MDLPYNKTLATEVILLGFSNNPKINLALFFLFLVIYLVTVFGNVFMICAIIFSSHLHTPMYYFLCNLSFIDLCFSASSVPKSLMDLVSSFGKTSVPACISQVLAGVFLLNAENMLLLVMAYDRYVAICRPLYYPVLMRWSVCYRLSAFVCVYSFMPLLASLLMPIRICYPNKINHIACELLVVLKLSCDSTYKSELVMFIFSFFTFLSPFACIILSYIFIISSVLKIRSVGRSKAFSTCSSHLTVVILFYGTEMIMYFGSGSQYLLNQVKYISVFYGGIIPMLNPLIYSLKNKEVTKIFLIKKSNTDFNHGN